MSAISPQTWGVWIKACLAPVTTVIYCNNIPVYHTIHSCHACAETQHKLIERHVYMKHSHLTYHLARLIYTICNIWYTLAVPIAFCRRMVCGDISFTGKLLFFCVRGSRRRRNRRSLAATIDGTLLIGELWRQNSEGCENW